MQLQQQGQLGAAVPELEQAGVAETAVAAAGVAAAAAVQSPAELAAGPAVMCNATRSHVYDNECTASSQKRSQ
jgi:hypothetical protein